MGSIRTIDAKLVIREEELMNRILSNGERNASAWTRRGFGLSTAGLLLSASGIQAAARVRADQLLPMDEVEAARRNEVAEVIESATIRKQGKAEVFPCHHQLYLALLNEPALTLALWKDLSKAPVRLQHVGPNQYEGDDGMGTTARWEFVYRSARLHALYCDLTHIRPTTQAKLEGRVVLIVRSEYFGPQAEDEGPIVRHDVEAFVKVDSKGWRALARTARPILEKVLEQQVQEAGWFVSLMGRLVAQHPVWAVDVVSRDSEIPQQYRDYFPKVVDAAKNPEFSQGRPSLRNQTVQNTNYEIRR